MGAKSRILPILNWMENKLATTPQPLYQPMVILLLNVYVFSLWSTAIIYYSFYSFVTLFKWLVSLDIFMLTDDFNYFHCDYY